jgi:hypothetical protein
MSENHRPRLDLDVREIFDALCCRIKKLEAFSLSECFEHPEDGRAQKIAELVGETRALALELRECLQVGWLPVSNASADDSRRSKMSSTTSSDDDLKPKMEYSIRRLISSLPLIPPEELERREQAAIRLRERHLHIPWYAEQDRKYGMDFWRKSHASFVLSD